MKRITDPSFKYTPAVATDIRKTFARARREAMPRTCHDALPGDNLPSARERFLRSIPGSDCVFPPLQGADVWTAGD